MFVLVVLGILAIIGAAIGIAVWIEHRAHAGPSPARAPKQPAARRAPKQTAVRRAAEPVAGTRPWIAGDGKYRLEVVGESNYQKALAKICGGQSEDGANLFVLAELVPEPDNPHDPRAVRVDIRGLTVGYLPRESAARYRPPAPRSTGIIHLKGSPEYVAWLRGVHKATYIPRATIFRLALAEWAAKHGHPAPPEF